MCPLEDVPSKHFAPFVATLTASKLTYFCVLKHFCHLSKLNI